MEPFVIGTYIFYYGSKKPTSIDLFLREFIDEVKYALINGIQIDDKNYIIKIKAFVCDAPAKAFVKGIVGHNAYFGCEKC